jgi:Protein of unknown function (DUF1156)
MTGPYPKRLIEVDLPIKRISAHARREKSIRHGHISTLHIWFVVEEGAGSDPRSWKLAQSLSALYPTGTEEKRWVDGVLARKKGLGF